MTDEDLKTTKLPKLTAKENKCLIRYLSNGLIKNEAYRYAYNCSKMSDNTVNVEASRFFSNPKIALWLNEYRKNQQKTIQEELNYTALDAMKEYNLLQEKCMNSNKTYAVAKGCLDSKCKLAGLFNDTDTNSTQNVIVNMGSVKVDNQEVFLDIGEEVQ